MSSDEKIPNADVQPFSELALDLQAGLVGVWQLIVVPVHTPCARRACRRTGPGDELTRIETGCDDALGRGCGSAQAEPSPEVNPLAHQRRWQKRCSIDKVQLPAASVSPFPDHGQHDAGDKARDRLLISGDKEEGHVLAIKEKPKPGPDHRLAVR